MNVHSDVVYVSVKLLYWIAVLKSRFWLFHKLVIKETYLKEETNTAFSLNVYFYLYVS